MKVQACPDADRLEQLRRGVLSEAEVEPLRQHLRICPGCARRLEGLPDQERTPPSLVVTAVPAPGDEASTASERGFGFLAPPRDAEELGRLGKYRILKALGQGGMGIVFQGEDPTLDRVVAIKVMLPDLACKPGMKERFLREARAAAALEHDHIVPIYNVDEERGALFIVMPFL